VIARRLRILGQVQGVWYRDWAVRTATSLGLAGWVRNRRDGSVEVLAIGASDVVEQLIAACRDGPPKARVSAVEVEEAQVETLADFRKCGTV
jgi:acylphosphatase